VEALLNLSSYLKNKQILIDSGCLAELYELYEPASHNRYAAYSQHVVQRSSPDLRYMECKTATLTLEERVWHHQPESVHHSPKIIGHVQTDATGSKSRARLLSETFRRRRSISTSTPVGLGPQFKRREFDFLQSIFLHGPASSHFFRPKTYTVHYLRCIHKRTYIVVHAIAAQSCMDLSGNPESGETG
jgi:hypothetical protein